MIDGHLELLRSGDRLVALCWRKRDPKVEVPNMTALLTRLGEPSDEPKSRN